ncbi:GNAT family N-acetyltransferase [Amycolatopsis antarctica]|uniref:GNAT family N-acetyltransferase n=1 Tax=Amycolatopsis antarctica TaxID=1854586 RepID=A0A263CW95_9PSEU|nr:GNAT family N-acetyltransferase [Amycolatopsis antarctica]OZM70239.1 GNAT family N-acetyltransferase [Amycolatopsis antarctica]
MNTRNDSPEVAEAAGDELTAAPLYEILRLRVDVFVVEQECPYPEIDGRDLSPDTRHFWVRGRDGVDGYLRVLAGQEGVRRVGRVCTSGGARGSGLGAHLMRAAMAHIGDRESVLDSQVYATGFYARFGYRTEGEEYLEDGIPHVVMRRPAGSPVSEPGPAPSR